MDRVYLDFETRSECDIKKHGSWIYSKHPSTSILCMAYAINDGEPQLVDKHDMALGHMPIDLWACVQDCLFIAHNASFEQFVWMNILVKKFNWPEIPISRWRCTMAKGKAFSLPGDLDGMGVALGLDVTKDIDGKKIMLRLSKPKKPSMKDPSIWDDDVAKFDKLYTYCITDVVVSRKIDKKLPDLLPSEQEIWEEDQRMNQHGIDIDVNLVRSAVYMNIVFENRLNDRMKLITNGAVQEATKIASIKTFLGTEESLDKAAMEEWLQRDLDPISREVLEIRKALSKSSISKYHKVLDMLDDDNRVRELLAFHQASTGRWGGRGIQVQNLPRGVKAVLKNFERIISIVKSRNEGFIDILGLSLSEVLSTIIRGAIIPQVGKKLVCGDYAQIEVRVLFWLACELNGLQQFINGDDLYINMAENVYNRKGLTKKNFEERQLGKEIILGCGFGMGGDRFGESCESKGLILGQFKTCGCSNMVLMTKENIKQTTRVQKKVIEKNENGVLVKKTIPMVKCTVCGVDVKIKKLSDHSVDIYRRTYNKVPAFWYALENAAKVTILTGKPTVVGRIKYALRGDFLMCQLPSGRFISYNKPIVKKRDFTQEQIEEIIEKKQTWKLDKMQIQYSGVDANNHWSRMYIHGAGLAQHCTQAVARDVMVEGMRNVRANEAYENLITIHDELLTEAEMSGSPKDLEKLMCKMPKWAEGLPVEAEAWEGYRYRKG